MGSSPQDESSLAVVKLMSNKTQASLIPCSDLDFLIYFVMGIYFGPDVSSDIAQKSAFQRIFEGFPPYTPSDLAGSEMKMAKMEQLYYFVLRKAEPSVVAKVPLLRKFLYGKGSDSGGNSALPQLTDLFPLELHRQRTTSKCKIIENVVVVYNPDLGCLRCEDIERFERLTGVVDFSLDCDSINEYFPNGTKRKRPKTNEVEELLTAERLRPRRNDKITPIPSIPKEDEEFKTIKHRRRRHEKNISTPLFPNVAGKHKTDGRCRPRTRGGNVQTTMDMMQLAPACSMLSNQVPMINGHTYPFSNNNEVKYCKMDPPAMIFLPSPPSLEEWNNIIAATKTGFGITGRATMSPLTPLIGRVDIGESQDSYHFRVALPGVKRNQCEFSCEVDDRGVVLIKGVTTTGEESVVKYSQVFKMLSKNLCPPGKFSLFFHLPGPINPNKFTGNFGLDGVLEGIVMKLPNL